MESSINVISAMTALHVSRPRPGCSEAALADWLESKARLHDAIAASGGAGSDRARVLAHAAFRRAARLRQDAVSGQDGGPLP